MLRVSSTMNDLTSSQLLTRAFTIMTDQKESEEIVTATTQPAGTSDNPGPPPNRRGNITCYICHGLDHFANIDVNQHELVQCECHEQTFNALGATNWDTLPPCVWELRWGKQCQCQFRPTPTIKEVLSVIDICMNGIRHKALVDISCFKLLTIY